MFSNKCVHLKFLIIKYPGKKDNNSQQNKILSSTKTIENYSQNVQDVFFYCYLFIIGIANWHIRMKDHVTLIFTCT